MSRPSRPKVAHLTTVDLSLRYLVLPQLVAIRDLGGEAVGISAPGPDVSGLEERGVRHIPLPSSTRGFDLFADLRAVRELWAILRRERPDVLHTHNPKPGLYGRLVGRVAGVPVVVNTIHGLYATSDDPWPKRALVYALEAIAARFSHVELVQSREDYRLLTRWRITPPARTRILGNGVDLKRFSPGRFSGEDRKRVRAELGAAEDTIVVGMVGRLVAEKGYPELFEAARALDRRYLVVCVGPHDPAKGDALSGAMIERASRAGVRFLGMRSDVDRLYAAMDLFVLPSHREGFPRAAMEAAAMGLPVIASDIRGCREVVEDGVNGLLFPAGDVGRLTRAIETLGDDPQRRRVLGAGSIEMAAERFDETEVVAIVVRSYVEAGRAKGLAWPNLASGHESIRPAVSHDAPRLARLHLEGIESGFLRRLGHEFLTLLYKALIEWEDGLVVVADTGQVVGYVAGVIDTGAFYRHFLLRFGGLAAAMSMPRLLSPSVMRRAWETLVYGTNVESEAELLAMAVDSWARGHGTGRRLGEALLDALKERGVGSVKVVVGTENNAAVGLYESLGFSAARTLEVHAGEESLEMTCSLSA